MAIADTQAKDSSAQAIIDLEKSINANPSDVALKIDLANTILRHYLYTSDDDDEDLDDKRLRTLLEEIPKPAAPFARACICYFDEQVDQAVKWLLIHAEDVVTKEQTISFDTLGEYFVDPFSDAEDIFWTKLADGLAGKCPDSAALYYLQALAHEGDADAEASFYKQALDKDGGYWNAAWVLGDICSNENNWRSAAVFYAKALESETAQEIAGLHFRYAYALGKLKRLDEEEKQLKTCLSLEPHFKNARNNLGVCLQKQAKYQEALETFDQSIAQNTDGPYPYRNRAYVLKKLNRYQEAIDAWRNRANWKGVDPSGRIPASIEKEITSLEKLIAQQADGDAVGQKKFMESKDKNIKQSEEIAEEEIEEEQTAPDIVSDSEPRYSPSGKKSVPREALLEEALVKMIANGDRIFDRRLKVYLSPEGLSGQQFITTGYGGRIDILAEDLDTGDLVVIELKKDESHEHVVGQISLYMAWIRENIASKNKKVAGIICVLKASPKLKMAARNIPNLEVFEYGFNFAKVKGI